MSVPEQVPYKEYRATGSNNSFEITFYLPDPKDLVVMVNKEIPLVGAYSIQGNTVVFSTPPNEGDLVELTRDTQLDRETEYKSYDNSFRPETINFDLDKIWLVLQESNLVDAKILARLKQEIEWRRTHDFNYDELAQVREKQLFDALKGYTDTLLASTNPGVFQGVIAGVVFARDGKSIQIHLEEVLDDLAVHREDIESKADQQYVDEQFGLKANSVDVYPKTETYNKTETYTRTEVDSAVATVAGGNYGFNTLAAFEAVKATIPANSTVTIAEAGVNQGDNIWDGFMLTKSPFDPVQQAKLYANTTKLDLSNIQYKYINGNMIGPKTKTVEGRGLNSALTYATGSNYASRIIPVIGGDNLFLLNEPQNYAAGSGYGYTFFDKDPSADVTAVRIAHTASSATDPTTSLIYNHVYAPTGAKFLVLNSKFTNPIVWTVHKDNFSSSYTPGTEVVTGLNGAEIEKQITPSAAKSITNGNAQLGDIYQTMGVIFDRYLNTAGSLGAGSAGNDWRAFKFQVIAGNTYYLKIMGALTYPFKIVYSSSVDTVGTGTNLGNVVLQLTEQANIYKFTVPENSTALAVFMNIKIDSGGYSFNISNTLSIQERYFSDARIATNKLAISQIDGKQIVDDYARNQLAALNLSSAIKTRFTGKKVIALGDSITAGTQGGYIKYLEAAFDTVILNHGSSGGRAGRVFDQVVAGEGLDRRNSSTAGTTWPVINFADAACVTLMIGTNDSDGSSFGSITDVPSTNFSDHATLAEYAALFPNNYLANIAFVIEYIRNKAPKAEIHIITPPYYYDTANGTQRITKLIPALEAVSRYYGVHLIYATYESGIGFKQMNGALNIYSYDGIHFNEQGNEVFGKFIAQKVLSFG
jgi:lysophospholipase L1-like esterase